MRDEGEGAHAEHQQADADRAPGPPGLAARLGVTTLLIALLAPSFALAMLGLTLLNLLASGLARRSRAIPTGQDTEWAEATRRPARHAAPPTRTRPRSAPFPPTRPLQLAGRPPAQDEHGVATARHTYIYDN